MDFKTAAAIFGILLYCCFLSYSLFCMVVLYFTNTLSSEYKEKEELDTITVMLVFAQVFMYVFFNPKKYLTEYFRQNEPSKMERSKEINIELDARSKVQNFIRGMEDKAFTLLSEAGVCPKCVKEMEHHISEPFSSCDCGTTEDFGLRPLQAIQRLRHHMQKVESVKEGFLDSERFEKLVETHNEFLKIKNS